MVLLSWFYCDDLIDICLKNITDFFKCWRGGRWGVKTPEKSPLIFGIWAFLEQPLMPPRKDDGHLGFDSDLYFFKLLAKGATPTAPQNIIILINPSFWKTNNKCFPPPFKTRSGRNNSFAKTNALSTLTILCQFLACSE